jgi:radical SAM superfamily enzyme YgiQ (UPF0313 family)
MKVGKVVLVAFNAHGYHSLALGYLKAYALKEKKLAEKVDILLVNFCAHCNDVYQALYYFNRLQPNLIGFSCYCWNIDMFSELAQLTKKVMPQVKIVVGGPEVGPQAEDYLKANSSVDYVVRGEGEVTFSELLQRLVKEDRVLSGILGLTYREGKKIVSSPERPLIDNLDEIPSPYLTGVLVPQDHATYLETFRGCPYKCAYCYEGKGYSQLRYFSVERIKAEVEKVTNHPGVRSFSFVDPVFNLTKERLRKLAQIVADSNLNKAKLHTIEVVCEKVDEETVSLLKKASVKSIETGPQSVNETTLKNVSRYFEKKKFAAGVRRLLDGGIEVLCDLIIGLPGDNFYRFLKSVQFVFSLKPTKVIFSTLNVLPGTQLAKQAKKFELKFDQQSPHYVLNNSTFPFAEIRRAEIWANSFQKEYNLHL